jgi:tetratricopeptide (TPR) repeat protein
VRTDLQEYGKLMATRFDARLIVYGIVVDSGQSVEYRPCIYVSSVSDNVDLSIMGDDTTICETGSVPFLENDGSDTLRNWITGVRQLTIGLERHQEGRTSEGNTLQSFEAALSSFELVTANPIPGLAALGHIYAGNAAVDIALRLQMNDPNCIAGRCRSYDPQIEQFYIRAWDHYSGVLELQTESDQAFYRALIGRGNVHYRLAQLTRLTSDTDEIVDYPQDYSIEYNCSNASLMLITNETGVGETLDWYQRSFAAMACYQQAARIAPDDADQQIKISFGLAQTRQWLGQEADNAELLDASIESYENAIEQLEQLYPQQEDRPSELRCLAGVAYGERGRVRWQSALLHQTLLSSQVRADLVEAVQILGDETNMCYLDTELSGYRLDLQSIP